MSPAVFAHAGIEARGLVADMQQGDHPEISCGRPDRIELRMHDRYAGHRYRADQERA